jgi:hypothetical protein
LFEELVVAEHGEFEPMARSTALVVDEVPAPQAADGSEECPLLDLPREAAL